MLVQNTEKGDLDAWVEHAGVKGYDDSCFWSDLFNVMFLDQIPFYPTLLHQEETFYLTLHIFTYKCELTAVVCNPGSTLVVQGSSFPLLTL